MNLVVIYLEQCEEVGPALVRGPEIIFIGRPPSPPIGSIFFEQSTNRMLVYTGNGWITVAGESP